MPSIANLRSRFPASRCAAAISECSWENTPLGPAEHWPHSVRVLLDLVLGSAAPKMLLWTNSYYALFNDAAADLVGPGSERLQGQPYPEIRREFWPALRPHIEAAFDGRAQLLEGYRSRGFKQDSWQDIHITAVFTPILGDKPEIELVLADFTDVTTVYDLQSVTSAERDRLRDFFEDAPVLIAFGSAPDFRFEFANAAFRRFYGDRPLLGLTVAEAIPEAVGQGFVSVLEQVVTTGTSWQGIDVPVRTRAGGEEDVRYVDFIYQPIRSAVGDVIGIFCCGSDQTQRWLANDAATGLRRQLVHSSRATAMETMAMTLAHELNQPLTAASMYLATAKREVPDNCATGFAGDAIYQADRQIQRAGDIIRRTRSLVSAGKTRTDEVDLKDVVAAAASLLHNSGSGLQLKTDMALDACIVQGDDVQLEQVFVNILRNASEASAGCDRQEALVSAILRGGESVVTIRDWGRGFPPGDLDLLFSALGHSSKGGLGIGLSLARTIVEAHGGHISARRPAGGGAELVIRLPIAI